ncbi:EamA family transporter [Candidatus Woesearchaeota archaeon]|nr:EamA family transporter [Candidatus Woesearchaeota archaeon]
MVSTFSVILIAVGSAIAATAAFLLKKGASSYPWYLLWKSWRVDLGIFLYVASAVLYILALRETPLSVAFPLSAMVYLFSTVLAVSIMKEKMNLLKWIGLGGILLGVLLVGIGS